MAVTQIATASAALAWMFAEWLAHGKPSVLGIFTGAVGGLSIALQHRWTPASARRLRKAALWGHVLTFWPLPALLGFHVLKSYWF